VFSRELGDLCAVRLTGFIVEPEMNAAEDATVCLLLCKIGEARERANFSGQPHGSRIGEPLRPVSRVRAASQLVA